MGQPDDFSCFMTAVIDKSAFRDHGGFIAAAKAASDAKVVAGGGLDDSTGYFVQPTVIETTNPKFKTMQEVSGCVSLEERLSRSVHVRLSVPPV